MTLDQLLKMLNEQRAAISGDPDVMFVSHETNENDEEYLLHHDVEGVVLPREGEEDTLLLLGMDADTYAEMTAPEEDVEEEDEFDNATADDDENEIVGDLPDDPPTSRR